MRNEVQTILDKSCPKTRFEYYPNVLDSVLELYWNRGPQEQALKQLIKDKAKENYDAKYFIQCEGDENEHKLTIVTL